MANDNNHYHPLMRSTSNPIPNFQRRTVDSARQLRDNFNNVMREIVPLMESARSVNAGVQNAMNYINTPQPQEPSQNETDNGDSFVINLDSPQQVETVNQESVETRSNNNVIPPDDFEVDRTQTVIEAQQAIQLLLKYVPFLLILLAKAFYDYRYSIFILVIFFATFAHTNSAVKKQAIRRDRRSLVTLCIELLYIGSCILFVHYIFSDDLHHLNIFFNLILIRTFSDSLTVGKLLWIVTVTDFGLKLVTVTIKILLTMLPGRIIPFQKRGKIYLFIEAISQMYRSIATIQPWLNFLLESYQGHEKIVTVFLSTFYMISKGTDLMSKMRLLKTAFIKLLQNVTVGSSPNRDDFLTAGDHCPICHDEYNSPVLLQCRHIFCEHCVITWFDREQTCPLCRARIVDDPSWRDGSTTYFVQLY